MTTINAAAALHVGMRSTIAALTIVLAGGLAACTSTNDNLLTGGNSPLATNSTLKVPGAASRAKIAIAPVIGAPDAIGKQIVAQLGTESAKNNIAIAKLANETVDYTLRGYIVAAREGAATKVSYIWDVTKPTGARVHRITGEEVVNGAGAGDPWSSVSPQVVQVIVAKTSQQLNAWVPQAPPPQKTAAPPAQVPVANSPAAPQSATKVASATSTTGASTVARAGLQPVTPGSSPATTGSIAGPVTALVPSVVGAPGDGATSLASALRNELLRNGIKPTPPGVPAYRVEGRVKMGAAQGGQQPIKIDWVVRDPKGASLGTVSQENKIPAGSLNGNWGPTANAAATAATQGILKLLPKRTASR